MHRQFLPCEVTEVTGQKLPLEPDDRPGLRLYRFGKSLLEYGGICPANDVPKECLPCKDLPADDTLCIRALNVLIKIHALRLVDNPTLFPYVVMELAGVKNETATAAQISKMRYIRDALLAVNGPLPKTPNPNST